MISELFQKLMTEKWTIERNYIWTRINYHKHDIAHFYDADDGRINSRARAHLMSNAPNMLRALSLIAHDDCDGDYTEFGLCPEVLAEKEFWCASCIARDAIKFATEDPHTKIEIGEVSARKRVYVSYTIDGDTSFMDVEDIKLDSNSAEMKAILKQWSPERIRQIILTGTEGDA